MIALTVNSAGDWLAGTYGWKVDAAGTSPEAGGGTWWAMGPTVDQGPAKKQSGAGPDAAALNPIMPGVKRSTRERADGGEPVSELTTARLSVYLRSLEALEAAGVNTVSSRGLAEQFRLNAAQI